MFFVGFVENLTIKKEVLIKKRLKKPYKNFEETFLILLEKAKKEPVTLETFLTILSGKGKVLLLIFLSLGFGQIPGVAIFLGLFICYLGLRIAVDRSFIWMPQFLLHRKIPSYLLIKVIKQILRILKFMKRWTYPRYEWATRLPITRIVNGFMVALIGISLAISPPVPLSGLISFFATFLIAIGLLNDDGVYIIIGDICALLYFVATVFLLKFCSFSQVLEWIRR